MTTTLLIFTLNEIDGCQVVLPQVQRSLFDECTVIDGGSTDGTVEYCEANGWQVHRQRYPGLAAALDEAMELVTTTHIVCFQPDGNARPDRLCDIVAAMERGYQLVIASRYMDGAKSEDDDALTRFGNWMFTRMVNVLFGTKLTDALCGYIGFRYDLYQDSAVRDWNVKMLLRAIKDHRPITEVSSTEPKRIGGNRKMRPLINGWSVLRVILAERLTRGDGRLNESCIRQYAR